ncbi:MAG: prepilin peptidase [Lachnospiraceae bacterium]|nr:prepilin peptidase [Candidatus Colinaster equi]
MDPMITAIYIIVFLYGIVIGSFLNVCIYRIPKKENIVKVNSHCMSCGHKLSWYELVPLFSYLVLRGKCRHCKTHISVQYPLIEGLNGVLYVVTFVINGVNVDSLLYCLLISALITLSVIDWRTYEIPLGINIFILALGLITTGFHYEDWLNHVIGFFAVSVFLYIIILVTKGRGFGGGDLKLMAVAGVMLGWKLIVLSFLLGCVIAAIVHVIRMRVAGADRVLAMGPYLSIGIFISMLFGNQLITWYIGLLGL